MAKSNQDKIKVRVRHVSVGKRYRRAGIGLTREYQSMKVKSDALKMFSDDPLVDVEVVENEPPKS